MPRFIIFIICSLLATTAIAFPQGTHEVLIPTVNGVRSDLLQNITRIIDQSIAKGNYPGAVIVVRHKDKVIYRGVFGNRRIVPDIAPMQFDTLFDIASLTKVVATTPAIMQLIEQGKLTLDAPVAEYWPEFAKNDKGDVTIRELLTHTSGLPAHMAISKSGKKNILNQIVQLNLTNFPGTTFLYSDVNFVVLMQIVEIITQEPFDRYVQAHIFNALQMKNTYFLPPTGLRDQIAPTELVNGQLRWGEAHDPTARALGGVSGNAGVFSNAHDLSLFAECLLNNGRIPDTAHYLLGPLTILKMITPQNPLTIFETRGLGWDLGSRFNVDGVLLPVRSFEHSGWTGTSIVIDPATQTFIIMLTSRAHPKPAKTNQLVQDRRAIADIVAASITDLPASGYENTDEQELKRAYQ